MSGAAQSLATGRISNTLCNAEPIMPPGLVAGIKESWWWLMVRWALNLHTIHDNVQWKTQGHFGGSSAHSMVILDLLGKAPVYLLRALWLRMVRSLCAEKLTFMVIFPGCCGIRWSGMLLPSSSC